MVSLFKPRPGVATRPGRHPSRLSGQRPVMALVAGVVLLGTVGIGYLTLMGGTAGDDIGTVNLTTRHSGRATSPTGTPTSEADPDPVGTRDPFRGSAAATASGSPSVSPSLSASASPTPGPTATPSLTVIPLPTVTATTTTTATSTVTNNVTSTVTTTATATVTATVTETPTPTGP